MVDEALAEELLWILQSSGADFAELFSQRATSATASSEPSGETAFGSASDDGLSLYLEKGGKSFFSAIGPSSAEAIRAKARRLANGETGTESPAGGAPASSAFEDDTREPFEEWDVNGTLAAAKEGARCADARVAGVLVICKEESVVSFRLDSEGGKARRAEHTWTVYVQAIAREENKTRKGARILGEVARPAETAVAGVAAEAARAACLLLEARPAPVGDLPAVLSQQAAGLFLHETLGVALEGDLAAQGLSFLSGARGKQVAAPALTLSEEPPSGALVDDEGASLQRVALVEEGVLRAFLVDRKTSARLGAQRTGSGWRGSYRTLPFPLLRHMSVHAGKTRLQEMIGAMEFGLYVARLGGGRCDAAAGHFRFPVTEGFVVREGALCEPIQTAEISGNAAKALKRVVGVGARRERHPGLARKHGEAIMVWDLSPAVAFERLTLGSLPEPGAPP